MATPAKSIEKSATFSTRIEEGSRYDFRLLYTSHENRASNAIVTLQTGNQEHKLTLNQKLPQIVGGQPRSLGVFPIKQGTVVRLTLLNQGANGVVSVDGLQLLPVE